MPADNVPRHRIMDRILCGYFVYQFLCTTFFDTQAVYPLWLYPGWVRELRTLYLSTFNDIFLANAWKHPWYLSLCFVEHIFGIPFYVWAIRCYFHGALARPVIIIPNIICSTYTIFAIISVCTMAYLENFDQSKYSNDYAPLTLTRRLSLFLAYSIMGVMPVVSLIDSLLLALQFQFRH